MALRWFSNAAVSFLMSMTSLARKLWFRYDFPLAEWALSMLRQLWSPPQECPIEPLGYLACCLCCGSQTLQLGRAVYCYPCLDSLHSFFWDCGGRVQGKTFRSDATQIGSHLSAVGAHPWPLRDMKVCINSSYCLGVIWTIIPTIWKEVSHVWYWGFC